MAVADMNGLLRHELGDLLYAEKVFLKGLKQMSKEASNPMIRDRIVQHAEETQEHIVNLERAFDVIGYRARTQKCDAAIGIDEERKTFRDGHPAPEVLEAFNLGAGLRAEHYEIAGYRSAIALARETGNDACIGLLQQNLDQEIAMATFLEQSAPEALAELCNMLEEA
jgi:ferritin-like metal-binding protein YciE